MTQSNAGRSYEAADLARRGAAERESWMQEQMRDLALQDEPERQRRWSEMLQKEDGLEEKDKISLNSSRLRALVKLNPDQARAVSAGYNEWLSHVPGDVAFKTATMLQTATRDFPLEETQRLGELIPTVFGQNPREVSVQTPGPTEPVEEYADRRHQPEET